MKQQHYLLVALALVLSVVAMGSVRIPRCGAPSSTVSA
jgi:hypothetical protein